MTTASALAPPPQAGVAPPAPAAAQAPAAAPPVQAPLPAEAVAMLKANPSTWDQFQDHFGRLPDGFTPPRAPREALAQLAQHPDTMSDFEQHFGYRPDPRDVSNAELAENFKPPKVGGGISPLAAARAAVEGVGQGVIDAAAAAEYKLFGAAGDLTGAAEDIWHDPRRAPDASDDLLNAETGATRHAQRSFLSVMSPNMRANIEGKSHAQAQNGSWLPNKDKLGDGDWYADQISSLLPYMVVGGESKIGGAAAYLARHSQALVEAAAKGMPESLARKYAVDAGTKAAVKATAATSAATFGVLAGSQTDSQVHQIIGSMSDSDLMNYAPYRRARLGEDEPDIPEARRLISIGTPKLGMSEERAKSLISQQPALVAGAMTAAATGLSGLPAARFMGRWLSQVPKSVTMRTIQGMGIGAFQGGVFGGVSQLAQNVAAHPITNAPPWQHVLESAAQTSVAGGLIGGPMGAISTPHQPSIWDNDTLEHLATWHTAREDLRAAHEAAANPDVKVTKEDIDSARDKYQEASVALGQHLLKSGALSPEQQQAVANAIEQARKSGVKTPEENYDNQQIRALPGAVSGPGQGGPEPEGHPTPGPTTTAGEAPEAVATAAQKQGLTGAEHTQLDLLNRVSNAEPVSAQEMHPLVGAGLVRIGPRGLPVMLPQGRRIMTALTARAAAATAKPETETATGAETATVSEKAKGDNLGAGKTGEAPTAGPLEPEAAERTPVTHWVGNEREPLFELTPTHYGALERIGRGKTVSSTDVAALQQAGLVSPQGQILPAGRRELGEFGQSRQTALEREVQKYVGADGGTLQLPHAAREAAQEKQKAADIDAAYEERARQAKADKEPAFIAADKELGSRKATEGDLARQQAADQYLTQTQYEGQGGQSQVRAALARARTTIPVNKLLAGPDGAVQKRFAAQLKADPEEMLHRYMKIPASRGGVVVDTDIARELSHDYLQDRTRAQAVHEPSSWMAKQVYAYNLARRLKKGETNDVIFTGGGTGSGKTPGINSFLDSSKAKPRAVYDGTLSNATEAVRRIDAALAGGNRAHIVYSYQEPHQAFKDSLWRSMKQEQQHGSGRTVSLDVHAATHAESNQAIRALYARYAGNPRVHFHTIDNSHGIGNAKTIRPEQLPINHYDDVRGGLDAILENEHAAGRISDAIYQRLRGESLSEARGPVSTRSERIQAPGARTGGEAENGNGPARTVVGVSGQEAAGGGAEDQIRAAIKHRHRQGQPEARIPGATHAAAGGGGGVNGSPAHKFLDRLMEISKGAPDDPNFRIVRGARVEISADPFDESAVYISKIEAEKPGQGQGAEAIRALTRLADEQGVKLQLTPAAYGKKTMSTDELERWYGRHGFEAPEDGEGAWERTPKNYVSPDVMARVRDSIETPEIPTQLAENMTEAERASVRKRTAKSLVETWKSLPSAPEMASIALAGEAGRGWYRRAGAAFNTVFGPEDGARFSGLMAALSPQVSVQTNFHNALMSFLNWEKAGRQTAPGQINKILRDSVIKQDGGKGVLPAWRANAYRALIAKDPYGIQLSGPKVNSFMQNLVGNHAEVTLDTHMADVSGISQSLLGGSPRKAEEDLPEKHGGGIIRFKPPAYLALSARVREAAKFIKDQTGEDWTPAEVQETMWAWTKAAKDLANDYGPLATITELARSGEITDDLIRSNPEFAKLFGEHGNAIIGSRYREGLGRLRGQDTTAIAEPESARQKKAALRKSLQVHIDRAAERLEKVRDALLKARGQRGDTDEMTLPLALKVRESVADRPALKGMPQTVTVDGKRQSFGPVRTAREAAGNYVAASGIDYAPPDTFEKIDPVRGKEIADAYDAMAHAPNDPAVKDSYGALIRETLAQFEAIKRTGLKIEFIKPGEDPYASNPRKAIMDVRDNNHLWVFPTSGGFGAGKVFNADGSLSTVYGGTTGEDNGFGKPTVNIGLNVGKNEGAITPESALASIKSKGADVLAHSVHMSPTKESTLVASLSRPLTGAEAHAVSVELKQESIAQHTGSVGDLHGPGAEAWRPFNPNYFLTLGGRPLSEVGRHPMLQEVPVKVGGRQLVANDVFRIVHDYFGHVAEGNGFRADGEYNAWRLHSAMYSEAAHGALASETLGQNAWVNFGPLAKTNRGASGEKTAYADQKAGLLPPHMWQSPVLRFRHFTRNVDADTMQLDPQFMGTGIRGAEQRRLINEGAPRVLAAYSYDPSAEIEAELNGANQYTITVPRERMYDLSADKHDIVDASKDEYGNYSHTEAENTIKRIGYMGYHLPNGIGIFKGQARFFEPVTGRKTETVDAAKPPANAADLRADIISDARRLTGPRREEVRTAVHDVQAHLGIPINVHNDILDDDVPLEMALAPDVARASGAFMDGPDGGSVHILAKNLKSADEANLVAIHEAVGHYGVRGLLGDKYGEVMRQIHDSFPDAVKEIERIYKVDDIMNAHARKIGMKPDDPRLAYIRANYVAEEVVAHASERALGGDIEADHGIWTRVVNFVRSILRKIGIISKWSDAELNGLIYSARNFVRDKMRRSKQTARDFEAANAGQGGFNPGGENFVGGAARLRGVSSGGNRDVESFLGKVGASNMSLRQRWNKATDDIGARVQNALFDHFHGIERAEDMVGIASADSGYKSASLSTNAGGLTRAILENGFPVWRDKDSNIVSGRQSQQGDVHDIDGESGLLDIFKPLGKDLNKWAAWMVANRAEGLMQESREHLFSPAEIAAVKALGDDDPRFRAVADRYREFKGKVLDWAQQAGIVDPESRAMWDHGDYVPFYRVMENGQYKSSNRGGGLGYVKQQIQRLRGGERNIGDPIENIMTNFANMMEAGLRAHAARATVDNLHGTGFVTKVTGAGNPAAPLDRDNFVKAYPDVARDLQAIGVDVHNMPDAAFRGLQKTMLAKAPDDEGAISVWRGGLREYWHVHDPVLFKSLQSISPDKWGPWMNIFRIPKRVLTVTSTMTPEFAASVGWKHMWQAFIQGRTKYAETPFLPVVSAVNGAAKYLLRNDLISHMRAQGGLFEGVGYDPVSNAQEARMTAQRHGSKLGIIASPRALYLAYRGIIGFSENMNRVAIYQGARRDGLTPMEAAYEAKATMDYHKRGNAKLARFIFDTVPFMGAHVSALHTLVKNSVQSPRAAASVVMRGAILSMLTTAYVGLNHNRPEYQALSDNDRAGYWHLWVPPGIPGLPADGHFRIPKPFESGSIFATIPEAMMDAATIDSSEPERAWMALKLIGHSFLQEDSLSPRVAAVWPVAELAMNKDTFTGSPILTDADTKVLPQEQDAPWIHSTYRWLAHNAPAFMPQALQSPKQLQELGQGYFGGIQDYVLAVTDAMARRAQGEVAPAAGRNVLPVISRFFQEGPMSHTRYVDSMYDVADSAAKLMGSIKDLEKETTPEDQARLQRLVADNPDMIAAAEATTQASKQVSGYRRQIREVQESNMSPDDKRTAINELQVAITDTAKSVWDIRPGGKLSPSVQAKLLETNDRKEHAQILKDAGMHDTARVLEAYKP